MKRYTIKHGNNLDILKKYPDNHFHSIVTDPPYGINFMGKEWDNGVPKKEIWIECLRVLKSGGYLLSFGGSRTYHRMAVNIEDAGFEIRDQIMWVYGQGFPKSNNFVKNYIKQIIRGNIKSNNNMKNKDYEISLRKYKEYKSIKKDFSSFDTALKPAHEPICMARKPFKGTVVGNVLKHTTSGINIDECRVEFKNGDKTSISGRKHKRGNNINTNLGSNKSISEENEKGRFPANFIHDGSEEVLNVFPDTKKGGAIRKDYKINNNVYNDMSMLTSNHTEGYGDSGNASRFFYCAKTSKTDRSEGLEEFGKETTNDGRKKDVDNAYQRGITERLNSHPTVKPTSLMEYLVKLVTPKNGIVLDPFNGSGSTGKAVARLNKENEERNFRYVGCELDENYCKISKARIEYAVKNNNEIIKVEEDEEDELEKLVKKNNVEQMTLDI